MDYFASFWSLYPRKIAKVDAERAARKIKESEWGLVMSGLQKYIKVWSGKEKQFIPHPATFLNKRRFEDEIEGEEDNQTESASYTFIKAIRNKNNLTLPDLPHDIKQTFFRMGVPWGKLQAMGEHEIEEKFLMAYNNTKPIEPEPIVDYKTLAAGSDL